jgi:chromosome segregation ATPase
MQLENQLNQLNRGSQRHNAEMQRARNTIETAPTRKQSYMDAIEKLTDSISRVHPDFSIDIGNMGKSQEISRKDAEAELQKIVDSNINDRNLSYSLSKIAVGKYRGFNLVMKRNYYSSDKPYEFALENPVNGESYGFSGTTKYPSLQSADYAIRAWKNQLESLNRVYLTVDEEVSRAKTMLSKPYRYASELENTKKELESLAEKIRADRERVMAATKSKVDKSIKRGE